MNLANSLDYLLDYLCIENDQQVYDNYFKTCSQHISYANNTSTTHCILLMIRRHCFNLIRIYGYTYIWQKQQ